MQIAISLAVSSHTARVSIIRLSKGRGSCPRLLANFIPSHQPQLPLVQSDVDESTPVADLDCRHPYAETEARIDNMCLTAKTCFSEKSPRSQRY